MAQRPRIIVVEGPERAAAADLAQSMPDRELVSCADLSSALEQTRDDRVQGVFLDTQAPELRAQADHLVRADHILETLPNGVAILDASLKILWGNAAFLKMSGADVVGRPLAEVIRCTEPLTPDHGLFAAARSGSVGTARLPCDGGRYVLRVTLAPGSTADEPRYVIEFYNVTDEEVQQQKLDALQHAGRALNSLDSEQIAEMGTEDRVELLKHNLRQLIRDILHYDVIEIRLLDRRTGQLVPLLEEGMMPEAAQRVLFARPEGNGVTGYVAATGKSYLCPDTTQDAHYIAGAAGARSSLTVPLIAGDEVIGTLNIESPRPNAFTAQDLQFAELFSREIAQALHTLELLSAERRLTAGSSIEAISREVALPVDDILAAATALLSRAEGHEPESADKLRQILAGARSIKQSIQRVGEALAPGYAVASADGATAARLKGLRVLVVDNDDRIRRSAHALLGRFGCQVETARTGAEAQAMARVGSYDAILMDIRLPDTGGYDLYRKLREAQPQARMVMMTAFGYDASHAIVKARQDGLRFVLFKPFRTDQLIDALVGTPAAGPGACSAPALRT